MNVVDTPAVRKSVTVFMSPERAFELFFEGFDTWWPRSHHIGKGTLAKMVIEPHEGGRCFGRETDGNECDWGSVLVWEPPHRAVLAWQITPDWQYEPDLGKASEVEVRFTAEKDGRTRVDLEHRHFERHGAGGEMIRKSVGGEGGWGSLLELYAAKGSSLKSQV